jgi:hypothetical protein
MDKFKIAYLGICFDTYTEQFVKNLRSNAAVEITYFNYEGQQETFDRNPTYFDSIIDLPTPLLKNKKPSKTKAIWSTLSIFYTFFNVDFFYFSLLFLTRKISRKEYLEYFTLFINDRHREKFLKKKLRDYDIVHLNGVYHTYCGFLNKLSAEKKLVCSFWGSDLWWYSGTVNFILLEKVLQRANAITVFTEEMKDLLVVKFGRRFESKIRVQLFGMNETIKNYVESHCKKSSKHVFCKKYSLDESKTLVCLSNNAARHRIQHDSIIKMIMENVAETLTRTIIFVLPFAYGSHDKSGDKLIIETALKDYNCDYLFLENFLELEEIGELRNAVDIYIQIPLTDSYSMALIESILSKNICITGSWLPYRVIKKNGVYLHEINEFDQLPEVLEKILRDLHANRILVANNPKSVQPIAFWDFTIMSWVNLFNEMLSSTKNQEI